MGGYNYAYHVIGANIPSLWYFRPTSYPILLHSNNGKMEIPGNIDISTHCGRVTLVGFGPGNPELLTIAGLKAIQQADIVFL